MATATPTTTVTGVTLKLSSAEAATLSAYLDLDSDPREFRRSNGCIYGVQAALDEVLGF